MALVVVVSNVNVLQHVLVTVPAPAHAVDLKEGSSPYERILGFLENPTAEELRDRVVRQRGRVTFLV
jgi:hypothetical protein